MTHLDKGNHFSKDLGGRLLHDQPHNLLRGHHHLIVLLLLFDAMGNGAGITRTCIGKTRNEEILGVGKKLKVLTNENGRSCL